MSELDKLLNLEQFVWVQRPAIIAVKNCGNWILMLLAGFLPLWKMKNRLKVSRGYTDRIKQQCLVIRNVLALLAGEEVSSKLFLTF